MSRTDTTQRFPTGLRLPEPGTGMFILVVATVLACGLVIAYIAAGGSEYRPSGTPDPCKHRQWQQTDGIDEVAEQFTDSALNGAACNLGVSREELAQAILEGGSIKQFEQSHGISDDRFDQAVRAGLLRGIDDGERAGQINSFVASGLRVAAKTIPIDTAISLLQDAKPLLEQGAGALGRGSDILDQLQQILGG